MADPKKNYLVDLNIKKDSKRYFLEVTSNNNFNLVYFEKTNKADGEEGEKKVVEGYFSDLFVFLDRAQYHLGDMEGIESLGEVASVFVEIQQELTKTVIEILTKDKNLQNSILKRVGR